MGGKHALAIRIEAWCSLTQSFWRRVFLLAWAACARRPFMDRRPSHQARLCDVPHERAGPRDASGG